MPKLEALCNCPFGVGVQPKGAHFEATEPEAKILVALGRARVVHDVPVVPVTPKVVEPEPVAEPAKPEVVPVVEADKPKRQYRRRDMTAEN